MRPVGLSLLIGALAGASGCGDGARLSQVRPTNFLIEGGELSFGVRWVTQYSPWDDCVGVDSTVQATVNGAAATFTTRGGPGGAGTIGCLFATISLGDVTASQSTHIEIFDQSSRWVIDALDLGTPDDANVVGDAHLSKGGSIDVTCGPASAPSVALDLTLENRFVTDLVRWGNRVGNLGTYSAARLPTQDTFGQETADGVIRCSADRQVTVTGVHAPPILVQSGKGTTAHVVVKIPLY
jgi:spore coat protein U-like protein